MSPSVTDHPDSDPTYRSDIDWGSVKLVANSGIRIVYGGPHFGRDPINGPPRVIGIRTRIWTTAWHPVGFVIFKLVRPTHGLPRRRAKADQVTVSGRGYQMVVAIRNFHNQSPFIFHRLAGFTA
jgi:hypothetical protein